ncbi:hypothetical protein GGI11_000482 [Coemansia sp. RSA 2049]|nr:hypothetical protein H4217_008190 [Coemansia sp. RSA 1939]KAJ2524882.1 hypothetical protein GGI11_000482 [Coemansia sp. RSA 2049]KAJ2616271.1 hypothetical protein EV177_001156 [Coemansia sp. RSA 1804]
MMDTAESRTKGLPTHDDSDYSVIQKAGMELGHASSGMLLPGIDGKTRKEAVRLCARDYLEHHVFFNHMHFHNHLNHHLLAVFSMGGSSKRLQEIFDGNRQMQRPAMPKHQTEISASNFVDYLSKEENYPDYVAFFRKEVEAAGDKWHEVVPKYIFNRHVFPCFMNGIFHPLIQMGYGLEFDSKAITATALAQACVHGPYADETYFSDAFEEMGASMASGTAKDLSLMQILDMLRDERTAAGIKYEDAVSGSENVALGRKLASKYGGLWTVDADDAAINAKYEELLSTVVLLYVSTTRPGYKQVLDFSTMHCLTSLYFMPIYFEVLSTEQKARLLHAHCMAVLNIYSAGGAPQLFVTPEHTAEDARKVVNGPHGEPSNPWLEIFNDAINHDDIHAPKVVRTLWRGDILSALQKQDKNSTRQKTPPVNWLYIARTTLDTITMSSFYERSDERNKGTRFWDRGMLGYDQFWEDREKS